MASRAPSAVASRGPLPSTIRAPQRRPDLVQRNFTAEEPNRLWVGDLSYLRCWEGVVYFALVIDVPPAEFEDLHARRPLVVLAAKKTPANCLLENRLS
jgi:hypothetical protein